MKYLQEAVSRARTLSPEEGTFVAEGDQLSPEDRILAEAMAKAKQKLGLNEDDAANSMAVDGNDKGMFGSRQVRFKEEVYKIPESPAGDASQPFGLLTKADLNNYIVFRKDDRLSFTYKDGTAGACTYTAKRSGSGEEDNCCEWSDGLIQELIDEGAIELI